MKQCKKCLETIESKHVHDFKMCSCGSVGIDGGISAGNSVLGELSDIENKSKYCAIVEKKKIWLPHTIIENYYQNKPTSESQSQSQSQSQSLSQSQSQS